MTNEQLKQEAIKKAYGRFFKAHKITENGWFSAINPDTDKPDQNGFGLSNVDVLSSLIWRPKSLNGIETNNEWIRVEEDGSNLPTSGDYYVLKTYEEGITEMQYPNPFFTIEQNKDWWKKHITHYQPIIKPKPPIY